MGGKFVLGWIAAFVVWMAGSFVVHGLILGPQYAKLTSLFRQPPEAQQYFHFMILAHAIMAGAFVWIYSRGVEAKPWLVQGIRFGIAVALLGVVPTYMIYYVVQPMPGSLAVQQMIGDGLLVILVGIVVAFIHRGVSRPAS